MTKLISIATENLSSEMRNALETAFAEAKEHEDIEDMNAFIGLIVWDWLVKCGYLNPDEVEPSSEGLSGISI